VAKHPEYLVIPPVFQPRGRREAPPPPTPTDGTVHARSTIHAPSLLSIHPVGQTDMLLHTSLPTYPHHPPHIHPHTETVCVSEGSTRIHTSPHHWWKHPTQSRLECIHGGAEGRGREGSRHPLYPFSATTPPPTPPLHVHTNHLPPPSTSTRISSLPLPNPPTLTQHEMPQLTSFTIPIISSSPYGQPLRLQQQAVSMSENVWRHVGPTHVGRGNGWLSPQNAGQKRNRNVSRSGWGHGLPE